MRTTEPRFGIERAVQQVGHEQAAEEHDLGDEEYPHPEDRGLELLRHVVEMVLQPRMMFLYRG
jgi:hypothetical protein